MKKAIQVVATIDKVSTMGDRSLRLQITTDVELPPEEETLIMQLRQRRGWFVFAEAEEDLKVPDIKLDTEAGETKSPSQRLRNSLFVYWNENTAKKQTFDDYYKQQMEKFINIVKDKL